MEGPWKFVTMVAPTGAAIATLWGGASYIDAQYAHRNDLQEIQADVSMVSERLEQKILSDRYALLQLRAWQIEDRYAPGLTNAPNTVREEYRQIKVELDALAQELNRVTSDFKKHGAELNRYYDRERGK